MNFPNTQEHITPQKCFRHNDPKLPTLDIRKCANCGHQNHVHPDYWTCRVCGRYNGYEK